METATGPFGFLQDWLSVPGTELTPEQGSGFSIFSLPCFYFEGHFLWEIWVSGHGQEGKTGTAQPSKTERNTWGLFLPVPCVPRDVCHHRAKPADGVDPWS